MIVIGEYYDQHQYTLAPKCFYWPYLTNYAKAKDSEHRYIFVRMS